MVWGADGSWRGWGGGMIQLIFAKKQGHLILSSAVDDAATLDFYKQIKLSVT